MQKHIIWSNMDLDLDDWQDYFQDLQEDFPEDYSDMSDSQKYQMMLEMNDEYLNDERLNLDIDLGETILVIGDIGRWDGRVMGYKLIESGNIKDCLYSDDDYVEWYVDGYSNLRATGVHHDGTNCYLYRVFKHEISDEQKENLLDKIYRGKATMRDITRKTRRLGDEISKVYGWILLVSEGMS